MATYVAGVAAVGVTAGAELPLELAILLTVTVAVVLHRSAPASSAWPIVSLRRAAYALRRPGRL